MKSKIKLVSMILVDIMKRKYRLSKPASVFTSSDEKCGTRVSLGASVR